MLVSYVCLFLFWFLFPSRAVFLITGGLVVFGLSYAMLREWRNGYFADRVDLRLHILVIIDLVLETLSFEILRLVKPLAVVESFHDNMHFIGCSSAFALLIGCYRLYAARKPAVASVETSPTSTQAS